MLGNLVRAFDGKLNQLLHTGHNALLMALMAIDGAMFASPPAIPGLFHDMTSSTELRIVLSVVIGLKGSETDDGHPCQTKDD